MAENHKILGISKSDEFHQELKKILPDFELSLALNSTEGLKKLKEEPSEIVILDSRIEDYPCESLIKKIASKNPRSELLVASEEIKKIAEAILQVAPTNITVSITGESGTGKELVARAIHNNSPRKDYSF